VDSEGEGWVLQDTPRPRRGRTALVVGAASRDLAEDDSRGWRLGGAVAYATLTLARLGTPVRGLIGVDGDAARAAELDLLRDAGAELSLVALRRGPIFENVETRTGRTQRALSASDPVPVGAAPAGWAVDAAALVLAPVAGELGADWADVAAAVPLVALGWQGLLRRLIPGRQVIPIHPRRGDLTSATDLAVVSRGDLDLAAGPARLAELAGYLAPGATVVLTDGERGGDAIVAPPRGDGRPIPYAALPARRAVDPTGAGDVFLAALVAVRLEPTLLDGPVTLAAELGFAAAAASLSTEGLGLSGVPALSSVRERLAEVR
jgi:sugar/nucleoside kinase (ribokinase family)